jgi:preprotein translocase subunit SecG
MTVLYYVTIVLHVMACLFLIGVVLLQQGKGQDLASAFGGGSGTQAAFGPRGQANVLSRATTILAALFMLTSLALTILRPGASSVLDRIPAATASPSPAASIPGVSLPATPESAGAAAPAPTDAQAPVAPPSPQ